MTTFINFAATTSPYTLRPGGSNVPRNAVGRNPLSALERWKASAAAGPYEGQWVLIDENLRVHDFDLSPRLLRDRGHGVEASIVYVDRAGARIGG